MLNEINNNPRIKPINYSQTGFTSGLDTNVNLLRLITDALDLKKTSNCKKNNILFIDFKSAFDNVNRDILFKKLRKQGFSDNWVNTLEILYSSITIRNLHPSIGVLQGSILSPMLFNRYVDDLITDLCEKFQTYAYADDISVLCENMIETKRAIRYIEKWGKKNELNLNKKKCGIMFFRKNSSKKI